MPWLIRDNDKEASENLLFVHVPRCGGTSLMSHFDVPKKSLKGRSFLGKLSLRYFFHRYSLLQKANFPVSSGESVVAFVLISIGIGCMQLLLDQDYGNFDPRRIGSIVIIIIGVIIFLYSAFWATAPTIGRVDRIRQNNLVLVKYLNMASIEWLTGINPHGYVPHLTAQKLLAYGYVSPRELENVCSMAIVRNPYARMISMYMWNRVWIGSDTLGAGESFSTFVRSWYKLMRHYRERREMEEYYTPCHCIPQYEYTHSNDGTKQIVQSVIKQEELKYLNNNNNEQANSQDGSSSNYLTVNNLPKPVRDALVGMPKINGRTTTKKWYEYYDQETLNLTYELYHKDFEVFGYSPKLEQRPDLDNPVSAIVNMSPMSKNNNNNNKDEVRHSNNSTTKEDNTTSPSTTKDLRARTSSSSSMSLYCVGFEKEMIFEFNLI